MNKKFSTAWKASKQPRKQRKYLANAPLSIKKKFISVNLAKPLRSKAGKRNAQIKKDDKVKIMRGKFKGKEGKVLSVSIKHSKVIVEGINVKKMDGSQANVPLKPSNLQIIEIAETKGKAKKQTNEKKENKNEGVKNDESKNKSTENKK